MTWASPRTGTRRSGRGAPWAGPGSASPTGRAAGSSSGPGDRYWPVMSDGDILQQLCSAFIFKDVSNNLYLVIKPSARNFLFRQNISNQSPQTEINVTYRRIFWYNFFIGCHPGVGRVRAGANIEICGSLTRGRGLSGIISIRNVFSEMLRCSTSIWYLTEKCSVVALQRVQKWFLSWVTRIIK